MGSWGHPPRGSLNQVAGVPCSSAPSLLRAPDGAIREADQQTTDRKVPTACDPVTAVRARICLHGWFFRPVVQARTRQEPLRSTTTDLNGETPTARIHHRYPMSASEGAH